MFLLYLFLVQHIVVQFVKFTYVLLSQSEIILKIWASDLSVSSKPGVSTKQISESTSPGNESLMTETSLVKDAKPCPTNPVSPVTSSMNLYDLKNRSNRIMLQLTELFPDPVGPMTLKKYLRNGRQNQD